MKSRLDAVFDAIESERDYQNKKWGDLYDDSLWSVGDWLIFIERYVQQAKDRIGVPYSENSENAMDSVRKIAALAAACMEWHGAQKRRS